MKDISLEEMLQAGVHFGHKAGRLYPKMKPFVFSIRNEISIIDLEKTREKLLEARDFVKNLARQKKVLLFVGTKRQAQVIIKKAAETVKMPYVIERWIGGTLTNFSVIIKMIRKFKKLKEERDKGELEKYTKKEKLNITEEIEKRQILLGGIENLTRVPDALFVVDVKNENTVIREATKKKIPIVALVDVNCNPTGIDYVIPANDDAIKSIDLITQFITEAFNEGLAEGKEEKKEEKPDDPKKGEK